MAVSRPTRGLAFKKKAVPGGRRFIHKKARFIPSIHESAKFFL